MSPRTATRPPSEPAMWRKLLARCHPDAGGSEELFVWTMNLRETVCENGTVARSTSPPRTEPYRRALRLLNDCREEYSGPVAKQHLRGATYKQLAAIGHALGMDGGQRARWYEIAESVPLSRRHAGHILSRLKGR